MAECNWLKESSLSHSFAITRDSQNGDRKKSLGHARPVQYLKNMSQGQNLSLTSGQTKFVAQEFQPLAGTLRKFSFAVRTAYGIYRGSDVNFKKSEVV